MSDNTKSPSEDLELEDLDEYGVWVKADSDITLEDEAVEDFLDLDELDDSLLEEESLLTEEEEDLLGMLEEEHDNQLLNGLDNTKITETEEELMTDMNQDKEQDLSFEDEQDFSDSSVELDSMEDLEDLDDDSFTSLDLDDLELDSAEDNITGESSLDLNDGVFDSEEETFLEEETLQLDLEDSTDELSLEDLEQDDEISLEIPDLDDDISIPELDGDDIEIPSLDTSDELVIPDVDDVEDLEIPALDDLDNQLDDNLEEITLDIEPMDQDAPEESLEVSNDHMALPSMDEEETLNISEDVIEDTLPDLDDLPDMDEDFLQLDEEGLDLDSFQKDQEADYDTTVLTKSSDTVDLSNHEELLSIDDESEPLDISIDDIEDQDMSEELPELDDFDDVEAFAEELTEESVETQTPTISNLGEPDYIEQDSGTKQSSGTVSVDPGSSILSSIESELSAIKFELTSLREELKQLRSEEQKLRSSLSDAKSVDHQLSVASPAPIQSAQAEIESNESISNEEIVPEVSDDLTDALTDELTEEYSFQEGADLDLSEPIIESETDDFVDGQIEEIEIPMDDEQSSEIQEQPITPTEQQEEDELSLEEGAGGFFDDDEDEDETIALTGDELDNILNTAEFIEEAGKPSEYTEEELVDDTIFENQDDEISLDVESKPDDDLDLATPASDDETQSEIDQEFDQIEQISLEDLNEEPETQQDEESLTEVDSLTEEEEVTDITLEEVQPEDPGLLEHDPFGGSEDAIKEMAELDIDKELEGIENLEDEVEQVDFDESELEKMSIDIPDSFEDALPESVPDGFEPDLTLEEEALLTEAEEDSLALDDLDETKSQETDTQIPDPSTLLNNEKHKDSPSADQDGLSASLKNEIKSVLAYMDKLLEALPEEKIEEFARSEHFEVYKRLFEELGL